MVSLLRLLWLICSEKLYEDLYGNDIKNFIMLKYIHFYLLCSAEYSTLVFLHYKPKHFHWTSPSIKFIFVIFCGARQL